MSAPRLLASVDLGSNSFRLQICEVQQGGLKVVDSLKQMVRLAAGLDKQKNLNDDAQNRALACLAKFSERLKGFKPEQVRAVATNTFRIAKNIGQFMPKAEAALGFPIEIIAGREEARLIYTGVVHTLPQSGSKILVVDIGGGSTEFVTGSGLQPTAAESLPLGCVTYSMRFFQGKITQKSFQTAITAARNEIQRIRKLLKRNGWDCAIGTSGSAKAICSVIAAEYPQEHDITYTGMQKLANKIIAAGSVKKADLVNIKSERIPVFAGGLAIMMAAFEELGIKKMTVTAAALHNGVFYELISRQLNEDMRDQTAAAFQRRYHVSQSQAARVASSAQMLMESIAHTQNMPAQTLAYWQQYLNWAGLLHEIGIDIAYAGYHKHSAYILENADMPGFSRKDQAVLSLLVLSHRGDVRKIMPLIADSDMWCAMFSLRLAALFCRARMPLQLPPRTRLKRSPKGKGFILCINQNWLQQHPLIAGALEDESRQWQKVNIPFSIMLS